LNNIMNKVSIAVKCSKCGKLNIVDIQPFDFSGEKTIESKCECSNMLVRLSMTDKKWCNINVWCLACNNIHNYRIKWKRMWTERVLVLYCPLFSYENCLIGCIKDVCTILDNRDKKLNDALTGMEWNEFFINPGVMLEVFNRIQDFHDKGRIICRCGSNDIVVGLNAGSINLMCRNCMGSAIVRASTALDLKCLQSMDVIYVGIGLETQRIN
jgi:hypothetical protein